MAKYVVTYLSLSGTKHAEIEADYMNQSGNLAIEFWKKNAANKSEVVAAFSKDKFISAISQD